jgi:hypothetical protein
VCICGKELGADLWPPPNKTLLAQRKTLNARGALFSLKALKMRLLIDMAAVRKVSKTTKFNFVYFL